MLITILKEREKDFDKNFKHTDKNEVGYIPVHRTDEIKSHNRATLLAVVEGLITEIDKKIEIHAHNSIPNTVDEADEGCVTCNQNKGRKDIQSILNEFKKELK